MTQTCALCGLSKYASMFPLRVPVCGMCFAHLAQDALAVLQRAHDESRCQHPGDPLVPTSLKSSIDGFTAVQTITATFERAPDAPPCSWCTKVDELLAKGRPALPDNVERMKAEEAEQTKDHGTQADVVESDADLEKLGRCSRCNGERDDSVRRFGICSDCVEAENAEALGRK